MLKQLIDIQCYNMKKCKKIKNVPKYSFGANAIQNWGSMSGVDKANVVTQGIGAVGSMIGNATSGAKPTVGGVLTGAGSGAAMGAMVGGVPGAIIGGAIGGITSAIGSGGSVNEATGEYELPSGIGGLFGHSKGYILNKAGRIKNGIQARNMSEQVAANYYQNNGYNDLTLAEGGIVPNTMAYLDDGELIRTPDGTIGSIPEEGKPTDSNLVNVPVGTQVLSDKLKVPGTNKTFAEMGKKLMKKSNKQANNIYAQNSQMLNERNNQEAYNALLQQQESLKKKDKNKSKEGIPAYEGGTAGTGKGKVKLKYIYDVNLGGFGYIDPTTGGFVEMNDVPNHLLPDSLYVDSVYIPEVGKESEEVFVNPNSYRFDLNSAITKQIQKLKNYQTAERQKEANAHTGIFSDHDFELNGNKYRIGDFVEYKGTLYIVTGKNEMRPLQSKTNTNNTTTSTEVANGFDISGLQYSTPSITGYKIPYSSQTNTNNTTTFSNDKRPQYYAERNLNMFEDGPAITSGLMRAGWSHGMEPFDYTSGINIPEIPESPSTTRTGGISKLSTRTATTTKPTETPASTTETKLPPKVTYNRPSLGAMAKKPTELKTIQTPPLKVFTPEDKEPFTFDFSNLYGLASTLTPLFNRVKPEHVDTYTYDPIYGPTEYDIDPLIREANLTNRIARYNMANLNPNTGAGMAFGLQSAVQRNKAIADAYNIKNNVENQLAFKNAAIGNAWGQYTANARHTASVEQAQNNAAARNINAKNSATALKNWGSVIKDNRRNQMDLAVYEMMQPMFNYGTEDQVLNRVNRLINKRR